jgi:fumarylacetoacetase
MNALTTLDETHDPARRSWVPGADGHNDFPVQNLPLGIFAPEDEDPRAGVAIGDFILDLRALNSSGLLSGEAGDAAAAAGGERSMTCWRLARVPAAACAAGYRRCCPTTAFGQKWSPRSIRRPVVG